MDSSTSAFASASFSFCASNIFLCAPSCSLSTSSSALRALMVASSSPRPAVATTTALALSACLSSAAYLVLSDLIALMISFSSESASDSCMMRSSSDAILASSSSLVRHGSSRPASRTSRCCWRWALSCARSGLITSSLACTSACVSRSRSRATLTSDCAVCFATIFTRAMLRTTSARSLTPATRDSSSEIFDCRSLVSGRGMRTV